MKIKVKALVEKGADVNTKDANGITVLMYAAAYGDFSLTKLSIEKGANPRAVARNGMTVKDLVSYKDDWRIEELLAEHTEGDHEELVQSYEVENVNKPIIHGITPLIWATFRKDVEKVKELLGKGADVDAVDKDGRTALMQAAYQGSIEICRLLLENGARVEFKDIFGYNALSYAMMELVNRNGNCDDSKLVEMLLDHGADINSTSLWGRRILYRVIYKEYAEMTFDFLKRGANILFNSDRFDMNTIISDGFDMNTVLSMALKKGHFELTKYAITQGADVNQLFDSQNNTVLIVAVKKSRFDIAEILLSYGADVNLKNYYGKTAIDYAPNEMKNLLSVVKLKEIWKMEKPELDSYYQWLPNEVSEVVLELVKVPT